MQRAPVVALVLVSIVHGGLPTPASAQATRRVSVDSSGTEADSFSAFQAISADGRFVAFESFADNLVAGDTNGAWDDFVRDMLTGTTERISVDSAGSQADHSSFEVSISPDGRYVAFSSYADNLVAGDMNGTEDVFVRDRLNGTTERVSLDSSGNEASFTPSISADGRFVAFSSYADNLVAGDTNLDADVFVHDRQTGATERVSVDSSGTGGNAYAATDWSSLSADGNLVAFASTATNLVAGDSNSYEDVFVRDRAAGTTERVSVDSSGGQGNGNSYRATISADGRFVGFISAASNLVAGDTNKFTDSFVHDRQGGTTERVNVDASGKQANGDSTYPPVLSSDGRFVAFSSSASNLVPGDTNGQSDIFRRDRQAGTIERMSVRTNGVQGSPQQLLALDHRRRPLRRLRERRLEPGPERPERTDRHLPARPLPDARGRSARAGLRRHAHLLDLDGEAQRGRAPRRHRRQRHADVPARGGRQLRRRGSLVALGSRPARTRRSRRHLRDARLRVDGEGRRVEPVRGRVPVRTPGGVTPTDFHAPTDEHGASNVLPPAAAAADPQGIVGPAS
jgi:Tol biopolymer transport system component